MMDDDGTPLYGEWSTIVDAPVTGLMPLDVFKRHYLGRYGVDDFNREFSERMARVEANGTSAESGQTTEDLVGGYNRAGENEAQISEAEILERYRWDPKHGEPHPTDEQVAEAEARG
jgi:hypothetical protein